MSVSSQSAICSRWSRKPKMPPGAGEDAVNMMATCAPQQRAGQLTSLGLTAEVAEQVAAAYNDTRGRCMAHPILNLPSG